MKRRFLTPILEKKTSRKPVRRNRGASQLEDAP